MNQLLDEKGELGLLCVLGAYVKRRANLTLICEDTAAPSVDELVYCIRESLTYLTAYGTVCTLHQRETALFRRLTRRRHMISLETWR